MQTFLPFPSFEKSMRCLDDKRLGKQRVEAFQLLVALGDRWALAERQWRIDNGLTKDKQLKRGWSKHPAALMWKNYEEALKVYMNTAIREWKRRGFANSMREAPVSLCVEIPPWIGDNQFHASHRANLLRKSPIFYKQYDWDEDPTVEYVWPHSQIV